VLLVIYCIEITTKNTKCKILVIDDQELVILSLSKNVLHLGYEVKSANNVFNAIAAYEFQPNLVIAD
jgi:CheY-like chemotaxis protein